MKKSRFNHILIALVLVSGTAYAGESPAKEFTKTIVKEFPVTRDGLVGITNRYGNIDIRTWNDAMVKIEVTIKAQSRNEQAANAVFERIAIKFENTPSVVRAATEITTSTSWRRWFGVGTGSDQFEVHYIVHVPSTVALNLDNKYGNIFTADMQSRADVVLKYGNIRMGAVGGAANIDMGYSKGTVQSTGNLRLKLGYSTLQMTSAGSVDFDGKYSNLELESAGDVTLSTGYTDVKISKLGRLTGTGKYDDYKLGSASSVNVSSKYTNVTIADLSEGGDFNMGYGTLRIDRLRDGFRNVQINTSYTSVSIRTDSNASFAFEANTRYCAVKHSGIEVYHDVRRQSDVSVKGFRGTRDARSGITASMNYGNLSIQ